VKGYAVLVHRGITFTDIITQESNEEFPHFSFFEKQAFGDLLKATAKLYKSSEK